ncbi:uncharacterized protein LOC124151858 [Haliotis rufescens]|uniref:uncharacterized protein LOC124151858 n=1 Tax=Haliotis rufescens TaxID=6454 RepID=UPI00201F098A|nr:uncharacterized protein LOC124151858 [Haliotis rufescens]
MTMFGNGLFIVLLAVLAPSLGCPPGPDELPDKLAGLLTHLETAKADFQCIFDVTNEQCPCQTPGDCFESDLEALNATLCDLINNLTALIGDQSTDCPALEGCAALVGGCDRTDIAQVDPVGTILPSLDVTYNVSAITVSGDNASIYYVYIISFRPFRIICVVGITINILLAEEFGTGTGIAVSVDLLFFAIHDYNNTGIDHLASIPKSGGTLSLLTEISCQAGGVRAFNGRVYFSDCKEIKCVNETGGDLQTKLKFSMAIKSFDVIDEDRIVFIDDAGGVWIYDIATKCFKLLYCIPGKPCGNVKVNRCSSLIYLAYLGVSELDIFNSTTCEKVGTLPYTTSEPTYCPSLGFEPAWRDRQQF